MTEATEGRAAVFVRVDLAAPIPAALLAERALAPAGFSAEVGEVFPEEEALGVHDPVAMTITTTGGETEAKKVVVDSVIGMAAVKIGRTAETIAVLIPSPIPRPRSPVNGSPWILKGLTSLSTPILTIKLDCMNGGALIALCRNFPSSTGTTMAL
jgi:hypothetical protein